MNVLNYIAPGIDREDLTWAQGQVRAHLTLFEGLPYFKDNFFERRFHKFAWRGGIILVVLLAAYIPVLVGSVLWVDDTDLTHERFIRSISGLGQLWIHPSVHPTYQPVADTILWLEYNFWGASAVGFHSVSILIHMANCMLVWFIMRRLNLSGAWLVAGIFALHPIQVQAVAWPSAQPMLIGTLFYLLSAMLFMRFAQIEPPQEVDSTVKLSEEWFESHPDAPEVQLAGGSRPMLCYGFSVGLFPLAVLSDPSGWTIPLVLLLICWWRGGSITRKDFRALLPFLIIAAVAMVFQGIQSELYANRLSVAVNLETPTGILSRILLPGQAIAYYLLKILVPYPMTFAGPQWTADLTAWWQYLFLVFLVGALGATWLYRRKIGKGPLVAIAFFLLNLAPYLGFVRFGWMRYSFAGNYLQYRASLGVIGLIVCGLMGLAARIKSKDGENSLRFGFGLFVLVPLCALFLMNCFNYISPITLWSADVDADPHSSLAHKMLAGAYIDEKNEVAKSDNDEEINRIQAFGGSRPVQPSIKPQNAQEAVNQLKIRVAEDPNKSDPWVDLGGAYEAGGLLVKALNAYEKALELDGSNSEAMRCRASVLSRMGREDEAILGYLKVIHRAPKDAKAHAALAELYAKQKKFDDSIDQMQKSVEADGSSTVNRLNLARLLFDKGHTMTRSPKYAAAAQKITDGRKKAADGTAKADDKLAKEGEALIAQGESEARETTELFKAAAEQLQTAAKRDPSNFDVYMTAGEMLSRLRDFGRAERMYRDACHVRPKSCEAWNNLGVAVGVQGSARLGEAIVDFNMALKCNPNFGPAQKNLESAKRGEVQARQNPTTSPTDGS